MTMRTVTRPPLLSSRIARENLIPSALDKSATLPAEIEGTFAAIDRLAGIWDGLHAVRSTSDPLKTKEALAVEYKASFEKAAKVATTETRRAADSLLTARSKMQHDAFGKAGLLADYPSKTALQGVLRSMTKRQRDEAIAQALATGDHEVMAAIHGAHPLLIGETTLPLASLVQQFVEARAPEEAAKVTAINSALEHLDLAYASFTKSADKMRDKGAEAEGEAGNKAAKEAEAKLGLALNSPSSPTV
jgi:hypothetical protein